MLFKADEYRAKAVECRERAMLARDMQAKRILQDLARHWWYLAERADRIDQDSLPQM
jgi:hypothetical protein